MRFLLSLPALQQTRDILQLPDPLRDLRGHRWRRVHPAPEWEVSAIALFGFRPRPGWGTRSRSPTGLRSRRACEVTERFLTVPALQSRFQSGSDAVQTRSRGQDL